ncbi:hypothetical protein LPJ64_002330 [Coemansia asiatica]|uniref:Uncharacterized protein n=1 Tax=Coemansia asiatica TaxID=1052880 RepID=A0A9W8CKM2_9FUNG|nr:hypothetical protein LPJ64_002330 [Coemansia asiatica]
MSYLRASSSTSLHCSNSPLLSEESQGFRRGLDEIYPLSRSPQMDDGITDTKEHDVYSDGDDTNDYEKCPTYYDVLKCEGQFASASVFFTRPLKPVHSSSHAFPWATQPTDVMGKSSKTAIDSKHHLRRVGGSNAGSGLTARSASNYSESAPSSSVFPSAHLDNSLPHSVFRLPHGSKSNNINSSTSGQQSPSLNGMTVGGRSLRRANQVQMSVFDHKVNLV